MRKYLFSGKYTVEGIKGVMNEGGSKRGEAADQVIRSGGGKLESMYFAFGEDDFCGIAEFPDNASGASVSAAINSSGTTTIKLTPLMTVEEIYQASKKTISYRGPGK